MEREEDEAEDEDDGEEARMSFTGVQSARRDRQLRQQELLSERGGPGSGGDEDSDDAHGWEEMQIRKAMKKSQISETAQQAAAAAQYYSLPASASNGGSGDGNGFSRAMTQRGAAQPGRSLAKPVAYNLQGIRDRLKEK